MKKRKKKTAKPVKLRRVGAAAPRAYGNVTAAGHGGYTMEAKLPTFKDVFEARNRYGDAFPHVYKVTSDDTPKVKHEGDLVQWYVSYGGGIDRVLDWKVTTSRPKEMEVEGLSEQGRKFTMKFVNDDKYGSVLDPDDELTWKPVNVPGGSAGSSGSMLEAAGDPPGIKKTARIEGPDENGKYQFYSPTGKPVFLKPVPKERAIEYRKSLPRTRGWQFKTHPELFEQINDPAYNPAKERAEDNIRQNAQAAANRSRKGVEDAGKKTYYAEFVERDMKDGAIMVKLTRGSSAGKFADITEYVTNVKESPMGKPFYLLYINRGDGKHRHGTDRLKYDSLVSFKW